MPKSGDPNLVAVLAVSALVGFLVGAQLWAVAAGISLFFILASLDEILHVIVRK